MITGERMAAVDENAAALGLPRRALMESSGNAVARRVRALVEPGGRVVILAGRGNNGGDAFVAARFLSEYDVTTILLGRPEAIGTDIARANWDVIETDGSDVRAVRTADGLEELDATVENADLLIDAMVGTGVAGELREPAATAGTLLSEADAPVLSVDVPSGLDAGSAELSETAVEADHVVTFHDEKPGLDALDATIEVADIGIPAAAEGRVGPGDLDLARPAARTGRAFVIGGGPYTGAPAMAAEAALRAGMELSFVAVPDEIATPVAGYAEDLIVQPFEGAHLAPEHVPDLVDVAQRHDDVIVLGPGLGTAEETLGAVRRFLESYAGPAVIDADALAVVPEVETEATLVCTPNAGELELMGGPSVDADALTGRIDEVEGLAAELADVNALLVKGATDVITDGERTRTCEAGTPAMAVGGTGDVLAGVAAGLLEHAEPFEAACAAAYVNGRAGESIAGDRSLGLLATELVGAIPSVLWGEVDG